MKKNIHDMTRVDTEKLYTIIKNDIMSLVYQPGEMIAENEMSKKYDVSRTTIRSVFSRLKSDGLLEVFPQKGTFVSLIDMEEIENIIYLRSLLENDILAKVISSCDDLLIATLSKNLNHQKKMIAQSEINFNKFLKVETEFHEIYYDYIGRKFLWQQLMGIQSTYTRYRVLRMKTFKNYKDICSEHETILDSIIKKDFSKLKEAISVHIANTQIEKLNKSNFKNIHN